MRGFAIWAAFAALVFVPIAVASQSPYLIGRETVYIVAGFAGIIGLALLLVQPMLAGSLLPGLTPRLQRRWHRIAGAGIVVAVVVHVAGLYLTSPMDALDALLLASPTPFSVYGVIAMWAVVASGVWALIRTMLRLRYNTWRRVHTGLAALIVISTVAHALLIEGTMGQWSKLVLCICVIVLTAVVVAKPYLPRRT